MFYIWKNSMFKSLITQTLPDWLRFFKGEAFENPKLLSADRSGSSHGDLEFASLEEFLQQIEDIPYGTALLGVCEDGLPVLADLSDQNISPIVILGDKGCGKSSLMLEFLVSALHWSPDPTIQFLVISDQPELFERYCQEYTSSCLGLFKPFDLQVEEALFILTERIEEAGLSPKATVLVFVDNLSMVRTASSDFRNRLEQILREGAAANIWLIAELSTDEALKMGRWLRYFRTRVLGTMLPQAFRRLGLHSGLDIQILSSSHQFAVFTQEQWLKFRTLTLK